MMRIVAAIIGGIVGAGLGYGLVIIVGFAYALLTSSAVYSLTLIDILYWTMPIGISIGVVIGVRCGSPI